MYDPLRFFSDPVRLMLVRSPQSLPNIPLGATEKSFVWNERDMRGLWFNFGHGHLGPMVSATTGEIIAREIARERSNVDLRPFLCGRFAA
jgi:glycine/D-amino acid oxidase-like deaminating enzyme